MQKKEKNGPRRLLTGRINGFSGRFREWSRDFFLFELLSSTSSSSYIPSLSSVSPEPVCTAYAVSFRNEPSGRARVRAVLRCLPRLLLFWDGRCVWTVPTPRSRIFSNILPACRDAFYRRDYFQTAIQTVAGTSGCRPVSSPVIEMIELLSNDTPILCSSPKKRMFPPFSSLTFRNSQWLVESELVVGLSNCLRNKNWWYLIDFVVSVVRIFFLGQSWINLPIIKEHFDALSFISSNLLWFNLEIVRRKYMDSVYCDSQMKIFYRLLFRECIVKHFYHRKNIA